MTFLHSIKFEFISHGMLHDSQLKITLGFFDRVGSEGHSQKLPSTVLKKLLVTSFKVKVKLKDLKIFVLEKDFLSVSLPRGWVQEIKRM
jgi:hypothetical protein